PLGTGSTTEGTWVFVLRPGNGQFCSGQSVGLGKALQNLDAKLRKVTVVEVERNGAMTPSPAGSDGSDQVDRDGLVLRVQGDAGLAGSMEGTACHGTDPSQRLNLAHSPSGASSVHSFQQANCRAASAASGAASIRLSNELALSSVRYHFGVKCGYVRALHCKGPANH